MIMMLLLLLLIMLLLPLYWLCHRGGGEQHSHT